MPPDGLTLAAPVVPPKQATLVWEALPVEIAVGWVMVTDLVAVLLFASVIVTVYEPAVNPVAVAEVPPEGAHE